MWRREGEESANTRGQHACARGGGAPRADGRCFELDGGALGGAVDERHAPETAPLALVVAERARVLAQARAFRAATARERGKGGGRGNEEKGGGIQRGRG